MRDTHGPEGAISEGVRKAEGAKSANASHVAANALIESSSGSARERFVDLKAILGCRPLNVRWQARHKCCVADFAREIRNVRGSCLVLGHVIGCHNYSTMQPLCIAKPMQNKMQSSKLLHSQRPSPLYLLTLQLCMRYIYIVNKSGLVLPYREELQFSVFYIVSCAPI